MLNELEKQEHANEDAWLCQLPSLVYKKILANIDNVPSLRASCCFFRDTIILNRYPNFKNPRTSDFKLPDFDFTVTCVYSLTNNRWVVIRDDNVISIMSGNDDQREGVLTEHLELCNEPLEFTYDAKFLVTELPNNILLVLNGNVFYLWDISFSDEPEGRKFAGIYKFETKARAICLFELSSDLMAFAFDNHKIYIMNMKDGILVKELETAAPIVQLTVNTQGHLVVVCKSKMFEVSCFDPSNDFTRTQYRDVQPIQLGSLKLSKVLVRNHFVFADVYQEDGSAEFLFVSDRVTNQQYYIYASNLGNFKSEMQVESRAVFWNTDRETQELKIQVQEFPLSIAKFSI